jgi:hypothetical protein
MIAVRRLIWFARCVGLSPNVSSDDVFGRHTPSVMRQVALLAPIFGLLYPSAAKADGGGNDAGSLLLFLLLIGLLFLYFLPSIIAFRGGHPNRWVILVLNVFFGSTIIVWVICLIWATRAVHLSQGPEGSGKTDGGESGLNIFANDEKKVRLVGSEPIFTYATREVKFDTATQLSKLKSLLDSGAISVQEFDELKRKLIERAISPSYSPEGA